MDVLGEQHPNGVFDMIFADPPYFLSNDGITCQNGKMVKVNKGRWDKSQGSARNHAFNLDWLSRCQKLLKPNGTLWVTGTQHVIYSVGFGMQQIGMRILNNITWEKPNPPPNLSCRYFTHATETILWAAKAEKAKHKFNYEAMCELNDGKQMKSLWKVGIPKKEEKQFGKHPTQKPVSLLNRILLASTEPGDWVFDPFSGSSTTGVAATKLGRKFVGCELDEEAIAVSVKRLTKAVEDASTDLAKEQR
ncbi:MAG: site-specific DNA-methyltransferase [Oxalobacter sp.]|nr:MAG: site-specific DNA-methyltransferase [Oxalobacter sp.]